MSNENDHLNNMPLGALAEKCRQETVLFRKSKPYDPRYCFQLFQRAFQGLEDAWKAIQLQYESQIAGWVIRNPGFNNSGEEVEYFVIGAFSKFWNAMVPDKYRRFTDLGSLLRYLQLCVHSIISDYNRTNDMADSYDPMIGPKKAKKVGTRENESHMLNGIHWQKCREWLETRLNNVKERLVIKLYIDDALKPREIYAMSPEVFEDVDEVYRIRQNVFARLGRDPEFEQFCGEG